MGNDGKKKNSGSKSIDDKINFDNWRLVQAITPFKCEHEKCQISMKENEYYILFQDNMREKNLCIKHGIHKVKQQKKMLEVFETKVRSRKTL